MIHSIIRLRISPQKRGEVLEILKPLTDRIGADPGCLDSHLYKDLLEEECLMFEQRWRSEEDLKRHLRSSEYRDLLFVMEMAMSQPEVRFEKIERTNGLETVEAARR